jgi:hypothetical protein
MAKNPNVQNAPSSEEILSEMKQSPPMVSSLNDVEKLLQDYNEPLKVDEPAAQDFVKKKRGRKPGQKNGAAKDEFTGIPGIDQNFINENPVISGGLLILLIDLALPNIMCFVNNKVSKQKIKASSLQLTEDERKQLEPLADQVAREMAVKANPLTVLIISLVSMYGMKLMTQKTT